ncbi:PaaI family thioesterase [Mycolicibacterium komossense]|uniref:PaaI family thioesterase n=1 Tax=Mycolicibacterium komossense TaxID=1779 RepID=A0ABT3C875_9MYCO|nr:PaaI family thioesterase [Mycolicibacterium komossense]MCV7225653.1 PaaI family thioesterase [Mycolicibacterium komossense]
MSDADQHDIETPENILRRFDIRHLENDVAEGISILSMPVADLLNPFTGAPTIGPLAILLDAAGGNSNHYRRSNTEWTVTSELTVELSPDGAAVIFGNPELPVIANSRPLGPKGATALSVCVFTCGDVTVGGGTVRSFYLPAGEGMPQTPPPFALPTPRAPLADLMAVQVRDDEDGSTVLAQCVDPILNNSLGIVNGGVASAGLELAASAAINTGRPAPMRTASLRVNFLRPFFSGAQSRYLGTAMRIGRNTAVADATAVDDSGKVALAARLTAYV